MSDNLAPSAPPAPAPGELEAQANRDIAELNAAAVEYADSADACDTPGRARFRAQRRARAAELRSIAQRVAQLLVAARRGMEDSARLDAISVPGAQTRVAMRALENRGDPPMRRYAMATIPNGPHASCSSDRPTLRAAIDAASPAPPRAPTETDR